MLKYVVFQAEKDEYMEEWKKRMWLSVLGICFPIFLSSQVLWVSSLDSICLSHAKVDLRDCYAIEFLLKTQAKEGLVVEFYLSDIRSRDLCDLKKEDPSHVRKVCLTARKVGDDKQLLIVPVEAFDTPQASQGVLRQICSIALNVKSKQGEEANLISARRLEGNSIYTHTEVTSKAAEIEETVVYSVDVKNVETIPQVLHFSVKRYGWEAFRTELSEAKVYLLPGEKHTLKLKVTVPDGVPVGGRETQLLYILPSANPSAAQTLSFITLRRMPYPFSIHTAKGWEDVREKTRHYEWATACKERYLVEAERWIVPELPDSAVNGDGERFLFRTETENALMNSAIAWQLSREKRYAQKVKNFLLKVSDYEKGFPVTRKVCHQSSVQEGHVFQHLAQAYDLIGDSGVLTEDDRKQIEHTFRLYIEQELHYKLPGGANWAVSQLTGAFFCALVIQDFSLVDEALYAPSGLIDKFRTYTMPDGWWYECTVSYNLWVASEYIQIALALESFGYSLLTEKFPVDYNLTPEYDKTGKNEREERQMIHHGHSFRIQGSIHQPYVTIKMMVDALLPFLDYRGWMFGINDATEREVGGGSFELAYYAFRDPRYAAFIRCTPQRNDLIYGVPDLPEEPLETIKGAYADNAGVLMLRSGQKEPRERIQAVLKYGTHGGYHGHFDHTGLLALMRYGRSFYNPEMVWYSYAPYMYNFYVQTSLSKNMVTVDLKQQEAEDSRRCFFYTGKMFQAGGVETEAAWSYPAYGGLRSSMKGPRSFKEKTEREARYFPEAKNPPAFGVLSGFTEPIFQRRLMLVTDDYVVLADYDKSIENISHRFDLLFQIKGLRGINAKNIKKKGHIPWLSTDSLSAAPLVTDVNCYQVEGTMKASFLTRFGEDADNRGTRIFGEPGNLYLDVYNAFPNTQRSVFVGRAPEEHGTQRMLTYSVKGDGRKLAEGKFGSWILGDGKIDIDITGIKNLTLSTTIENRVKNIYTLFWGEALLILADGREIPLSKLPCQKNNVLENSFGYDKDYIGGRINMNGENYAWGLPAEPQELDDEAVYTFDLTNLNAVRLRTVVGGDYPLGDETERRKTLGVTANGSSARFLTVVEPYESNGKIESVKAFSADSLIVRLKDGREHRFFISGMDAENDKLSVIMQEWINGKLMKEERTR